MKARILETYTIDSDGERIAQVCRYSEDPSYPAIQINIEPTALNHCPGEEWSEFCLSLDAAAALAEAIMLMVDRPIKGVLEKGNTGDLR